MPAAPPIAYATLTTPPSPSYIFSITPSPSTPHLILRHPSPTLSLADAQTLQTVEHLRDGHTQNITDVAVDAEVGGAVWSSGKEGRVVMWDERSRRVGMTTQAFVRKPLPVLSIAVAERDHLVIAGTEVASSEAHILFWDIRNPKTPAYTHSSTHSDDITHLSLLPSTSTFLGPPPSASASSSATPSRLLLSASTDGLVALSDYRESDEDEAVQTAENIGASVASAGAFSHKGGPMRVWARSDMDSLARWKIGRGDEGEIELQDLKEYASDEFRFRSFNLPSDRPHVTQTAAEERQQKTNQVVSGFVVDVCPSLGVGKRGDPMLAVGSNAGDIVLMHASPSTSASPSYTPSAYLVPGPSAARGHADVVRCLYHSVRDEALYTGSEDGVLAGWSLAGLPRLATGDPEADDDGGDGREDDESESEIESDGGMDVDDSGSDDEDEDEEEEEEGGRYGPVLGGGRGVEQRRDRRKEKRGRPY